MLSTASSVFMFNSQHDHLESMPSMGQSSRGAEPIYSAHRVVGANYPSMPHQDTMMEEQKKEAILKTPVSLLNEVCAKAKVVPVFQTTEDGPPHDRSFECIVKVMKQGCSWEGKGQAKAKKDAKQEAAKALLISMDNQVEKLLAPTKPVVSEPKPMIETDPEPDGNPVGDLNDLTLRLKRLPPEYEEVGEEGKPHERIYIIACKLGSQIVEKGKGRSKKHAKKAAAFKVNQRLTQLMSKSEGINLLKEEEENIEEKLKNLSLLNKKQVKQVWKLADWFKEFKERSGSKFLSLKDNKLNILNTSDQTKLLREIAEEQKFKVEYLDIEKREGDEQFSCVVSIGIEPVAIFLGRGGSKTQARKNAADRAIEFLIIAIN